jgi:peroxiredoxin family protein
MALHALAIVATRGTSNNIFQVATLVRAATALELVVDVLFVGDALWKIRRDRLNLSEWSAAYEAVLSELDDRLASADFTDMEAFLRDAKEHGDHVHFWAEADSLRVAGLDVAGLTPLLDGVRSRAAFLAEVRGADAVLTF